MKELINRILARFNYKIKRIKPQNPDLYFLNHLDADLKARKMMFSYYGVNLLLDVGANVGQY